MKTLKLSAVALAVATSGLANAADIETICSSASGCQYVFASKNNDSANAPTWSESNKELGNSTQKNLKVALKSQHYQNIPATETGIAEDGYRSKDRLISIYSFYDDSANSELLIPTGATLTLSGSKADSEIISIRNAVANIAKGVTLTVDKNYAEQNNLDNSKALGSEAIYASGNHTIVNTSADIILNSKDAEGLTIHDNGKLFAKDHKVTINSPDSTGILTFDNSTAVVDNVQITGKESSAGIFSEDGSHIQLNNSTITLGKNSFGAVLSQGNVEIANSVINSSWAIAAEASDYVSSRKREPFKNVVNITNSTVTGSDTLFSLILTEDDKNFHPSQYRATLNAEGSNLYGRVAAFDNQEIYKDEDEGDKLKPDLPHSVDVTLKNSDWTLNGNSEMEMLAVAKSNVTFEPSATFKTLTVNDTLIGADSVFHLNTDLANEKSDQIVLKAAGYGEHALDVKDSGNEPKAPNGKVTLVKATQASEATFKLFNRDYVDAGAYRYRLHQQGYDWILSNNANEKSEKPAVQPTPIAPVNPTTPTDTTKPVEPTKPVAPTETVKPSEPAKPVVPADTTKPTDTATTTPVAPVVPQPTPPQPDDHPAVQRMLSKTANTLVSLRQAQLQLTELELNGIHQRLGELKTAEASNVWVRNHNARQERKAQSVAADSLSSGFKQDTTLLQIGADTAISDNWRAGGFVGTSRSDIDFNGDYGKGKLKGVHLGLYATFQTQNGIYADNIVKFDRLRTSGDGVANQSYNGYTLSSEIGKAFAFGEGWTVTPQAQLAWTHLSSGDNVENLSALTSRAGVRVSKAIALANGNITPFIEVNGIHTHHRHSQVRVSQSDLYVKGAGSRIETAAGVSAKFANHRLGVQLSTTNSDRLKQPLAVQVNYRYSW